MGKDRDQEQPSDSSPCTTVVFQKELDHRIDNSGVDEQLIMKRTGHRSTDGVRIYKRTSDQQNEDVSSILQTNAAVVSDDINSLHSLKRQKVSLDEERHFSFNNCTNIHITIQK